MPPKLSYGRVTAVAKNPQKLSGLSLWGSSQNSR